MSFNIFRWIVEAINPCVHQWEKIDTLYDDKDDPNHIKIVNQCQICGTIKTTDIKGPPKPKKCSHKWVNQRVNDLYSSHETKGKLPIGQVYNQQCSSCGEMRRVTLRS